MSRDIPPVLGEEEDFPEPPRLRALRRAVTGLMVVLALGVVVIAGTVAWRLGAMRPASFEIPTAEALELPAGAEILALGGDGPHILVAVREAGGERLLTFRKSDGALLSETEIHRR